MPRTIGLVDDRKRDAHISIEGPKSKRGHRFVGPDSRLVQNQRFIKATENRDFASLLQAHEGDLDALGAALVDGDPEVDLELVGRKLGDSDRVWVRPDGSVLYSARVLKVVYDPHGTELSRGDFVDVEATINDESPLQWSGRFFPIEQVVQRFALVRKLQLRHVNGLTWDFLYEIAKRLDEENKMLFVGSGARGNKPLVFQSNGSPYRGFLEGRVDGDRFKLILHLSNLELKPIPKPPEAEGGDA